MDESNIIDLLPLIAECVLRRAAEMRAYADRIEREFGGDPDFEDAKSAVRELRACADSIERVGTLEGAPALIRYFKRARAAREALSRRKSSAMARLTPTVPPRGRMSGSGGVAKMSR